MIFLSRPRNGKKKLQHFLFSFLFFFCNFCSNKYGYEKTKNKRIKYKRDGVEKWENHSHSDGVSAESVEDVGGPSEIQDQLSRACVLHIFNL